MDDLTQFDNDFNPAKRATTAGRKPTAQQTDIYDAIAGDQHVVVRALAGTGKTTTAVDGNGHAKGRRGFCCFNKHIAVEMGRRLGTTAAATTMHAMGNRAVRQRFKPTGEPDQRKTEKLLLDMDFCRFGICGAHGNSRPTSEGIEILALTRLCKLTLTDPADAEALGDLTDHFGMTELPSDAGAVAANLLDRCRESTKTIDFDDMVWLPVVHNLNVDRYDVLFVDEVQDLNRAQQKLATMASRDGRMVPIGDELQSLYGFTGADPESMPRLTKALQSTRRGAKVMPLTVTFRCPKSHVDVANRLVPDLRAADTAADGIVADVGVDAVERLAVPGDLVICRKNAPLVAETFALLSKGTPAVMLGRDFGKGLIALVDRLKADDISDLIQKLHAWSAKEAEKLTKKNAPESAFQVVEDKAACLMEMASHEDTVWGLRQRIDRLFADIADPAKTVRLSSVHRAKGSEADRVFIVEPQCMPMVSKKTKPWEAQQERNILYVAITRAKKELYFCGQRPEMLGGPAKQRENDKRRPERPDPFAAFDRDVDEFENGR
jgi:DNA helicase-2/ATP-dependent DNA helicase PcrA